jgi:hypothetical protein
VIRVEVAIQDAQARRVIAFHADRIDQLVDSSGRQRVPEV